MNTTINSFEANVSTNKTTLNNAKTSVFWQQAEDNRFGIIPMLLLVIACIGGVAAAFGAGSNSSQVALVIFPTILSLAFMLAVAPMRLVVWASIIALFFDLLVFLI